MVVGRGHLSKDIAIELCRSWLGRQWSKKFPASDLLSSNKSRTNKVVCASQPQRCQLQSNKKQRINALTLASKTHTNQLFTQKLQAIKKNSFRLKSCSKKTIPLFLCFSSHYKTKLLKSIEVLLIEVSLIPTRNVSHIFGRPLTFHAWNSWCL